MQLQATVDDWCHGDQGAHVGVHLLVHQPEGQAFISHQSLEGWVTFYHQHRDNGDSTDTKCEVGS